MIEQGRECLDIRTFCCDPEWKDKLSSKMMELSLSGWWYKSYNCMRDHYAGYIMDIQFVRFINNQNDTNIDADIIENIISIPQK